MYVLWRRSNRIGDVGQRPNSDLFSLTPFKICAGIGVSQLIFMLPLVTVILEGLRGSLSDVDGGLIGFVYWSAYFVSFLAFGSNFYFSFAVSDRYRRAAKDLLHALRPAPRAIEPQMELQQVNENPE